jgi:hypothetical protein
VDITSTEGLSNVSTLVHSPSKIAVARSFRGDKAQSFINLIDRVSDLGTLSGGPPETDHHTQLLDTLPHLDEKLSRRSSRLLYKICKACGTLPTSYFVQPGLTHVGEVEWCGGFADVSKGEYRGRPVAVKHLRIGTMDGFDKVFKVSDCARPGALQSLSSHSETLPGSSHLETLVPPEYLAAAGSFRVEGPPTFPYHLRVDAQRECDGVHKVQSGGQPFAFGEYRTFQVGVYVLTRQPIAFRGCIRRCIPSRTRDCARRS